MVKMLSVSWMIIFFTVFSHAQSTRLIRYRDAVSPNITIRKNLTYSNNIPARIKKKIYLFDLYEPNEDSLASRPLIIWMHGGGFKFGSKKAKGIRIWSKDFARRGYLCAAINYRLSKKNPLRNFNALVKGCYEAVQDVTQAIAFFKKNAVLYKIDTNRIILAGNSAGAIIALQNAYSSDKKLSALTNTIDSNQSSTMHNPNHVAAVINFWGGIFDTSWLQHTRVPIVSVHGRKDRVVPYNQNGSALYGSFLIHQKADSLNIPNRLKTYNRYGHELQKHFIPLLRSRGTKRRWKEASKFASDFIYTELFK